MSLKSYFKRTMHIAWLKNRARKFYREATSDMSADAGFTLSDHIQGGRISRARREFDRTMDKLAELDPEGCPAFRFGKGGR